MELLLALPAGRTPPPDRRGLVPVHMAYRVGNGPVLLGIPLPDDLRGGVMFLDCVGFDGTGDPLLCCDRILRECRHREYQGILCAFDSPPTHCLSRLTAALDDHCAEEGRTLYVPESYAACAPSARILIPSPVTGGTLERRLRSAVEQYGAARTVLAVEWMREDLPLPCDRRGEPLSPPELENQMRRLEPAVFFDRGLCAHYYTYRSADAQAHFVLFDTPRSIRAKLALAERLALPATLLALPEVEHHWEEIFG